MVGDAAELCRLLAIEWVNCSATSSRLHKEGGEDAEDGGVSITDMEARGGARGLREPL